MRKLVKSITVVSLTSLLLGSSLSARAEGLEPIVPAAQPDPGAALSEPVVRCVTLADNVLDVRVASNASDVWSLDAGASIGNSAGQVTLYVISSASDITISAQFMSLNDRATVGTATLVPMLKRSTVSTVVSLEVGQSIEFIAHGGATTQAAMVPNPGPVGPTNKAVIKRVTTCPTA